ncbi:hypothetical protein M970_111200 [Encephalitozoon cuniculi EcunIII-L]|uniref:Uncharacterized protein n=1 Tax=Encephalitozoon cuniculi TaxID=6035 RepID=M1JHS7_ENCCN|nr:hypothetical protein ECU11_1210 [Encephalitozoon cuniculi]KMV65079.1 hypothetical protein M970_111200 [Encephalitozoon cuniculi EcunIII-L]UYI26327.1 spore wall protein 7 [Encephalitozoon cuniculi]
MFLMTSAPLLLVIGLVREGLALASEYNFGGFEADPACTKDDKIYLVSMYAHFDRGTIDAIFSAFSDCKDEREAVEHYLKSRVIGPYNDYLSKFKVKIGFDAKDYDVNELVPTKRFDSSCELVEPVGTRTSAVHNHLLNTYKDRKIGIHLFLWSCPTHNENIMDKIVIGEPKECARSIGVLWRGTEETIDFIKSGISEAISGAKDLFLNQGFPSPRDEDKLSYVCQHVDTCIASKPSVNGAIIFGIDETSDDAISTHIDVDTHPSDVYIPPERGARAQRVIYVNEPSDSVDDECKY